MIITFDVMGKTAALLSPVVFCHSGGSQLCGKPNGPRNLKLLAERKLELDMTGSVDGKGLPPGFPHD